jgi:hypothetical protein
MGAYFVSVTPIALLGVLRGAVEDALTYHVFLLFHIKFVLNQ